MSFIELVRYYTLPCDFLKRIGKNVFLWIVDVTSFCVLSTSRFILVKRKEFITFWSTAAAFGRVWQSFTLQ